MFQHEGVFHSEKRSGEIQSCKRPKKLSHATTFDVHESHVKVVWRNCRIPSVGQFGYALSVLHRTHSSIASLDEKLDIHCSGSNSYTIPGLKDSREPLATASAHSSFSMWGLSRPGLQAVGLALAHMMRSVQLDMYDCVKRLT